MYFQVLPYDVEITDAMLKHGLPGPNTLFICRRNQEQVLYDRLRNEGKIDVTRGEGFTFGESIDPSVPKINLGRSRHQTDGIDYQIWGPGDSLFGVYAVHGLGASIDRAIRSALNPSSSSIKVIWDQNYPRTRRIPAYKSLFLFLFYLSIVFILYISHVHRTTEINH
jgi:hypothetical protein